MALALPAATKFRRMINADFMLQDVLHHLFMDVAIEAWDYGVF
jgi:hypothetical protein